VHERRPRGSDSIKSAYFNVEKRKGVKGVERKGEETLSRTVDEIKYSIKISSGIGQHNETKTNGG